MKDLSTSVAYIKPTYYVAHPPSHHHHEMTPTRGQDDEDLAARITAVFNQTCQAYYGYPPPSEAVLLPTAALLPQFRPFASDNAQVLDEIFPNPDHFYSKYLNDNGAVPGLQDVA